MVLGLRANTRKGPSVQLDIVIHILEIKPWPPSQSLRTLRNVVIQWEHGDTNSGITNQVVPLLGTGSDVVDGRIEFNESFKLHATLVREMSIKGGDGDSFQKNCVEFSIYEPRRDKTVKGQLLGSAILNLADYGIVKESLSISAPVNCKRTYRNITQPLLFLKIQPVEKNRTSSSSKDSLMREASMDRTLVDCISQYSEEAEVSSYITDDEISWHSSQAVASAGESNGSLSPPQKEKDETRECHDKERIIDKKEQENCPASTSTENSACNDDFLTLDKLKRGKSVRCSPDGNKRNGLIRGSEQKDARLGTTETQNQLSKSKVQQLEHRINDLEAELREAAAIELSLYSIISEHGSSIVKVHAPARRLSRLYFHACKHNLNSRRGSAAKSIVSGLVLVAKACGHDVPRLTFWLSNSVVLRMIIGKSLGSSRSPISVGSVTGTAVDKNGMKNLTLRKWDPFPSKVTRTAIEENICDWENPVTITDALEKLETWIFSRIVECVWWQTFTPRMQSNVATSIHNCMDSVSNNLYQRTSSLGDQQPVNFSLELWKHAFRDSFERLCPVRAGGHECGCLPLLSKLIMEQLIVRLDVAMFNAILRESVDDIPTDPVADPISDAEVLPIPTGKASFGAGAQLKNVIGHWSRWLTDLFGIDDNELLDEDERSDTTSKSFHLLNALSDLMMLPKDMLLSHTIRKEVCPTFGTPLIKRILSCFIPDEFCPDPIPGVVLEALESENPFDSEEGCIMSFPCDAATVAYTPPSASSVEEHPSLKQKESSLRRKSQTSDDELDELDSPLKSIHDHLQASPSSGKPFWIEENNKSQTTLRYQLLREAWMDSN